jgi:hypothetical protein
MAIRLGTIPPLLVLSPTKRWAYGMEPGVLSMWLILKRKSFIRLVGDNTNKGVKTLSYADQWTGMLLEGKSDNKGSTEIRYLLKAFYHWTCGQQGRPCRQRKALAVAEAPRQLCHSLWHNCQYLAVKQIPMPYSIQIPFRKTADIWKTQPKVVGKSTCGSWGRRRNRVLREEACTILISSLVQ